MVSTPSAGADPLKPRERVADEDPPDGVLKVEGALPYSIEAAFAVGASAISVINNHSVKYFWADGNMHGAPGQWWLLDESGRIGVGIVERESYINEPNGTVYAISGPLVGAEGAPKLFCDFDEARRAAEAIVLAAGGEIVTAPDDV